MTIDREFGEAERQRLCEVGQHFEDAVRASKAFSWIGIVAGEDQYGRMTVDVYLTEKNDGAFRERDGSNIPNVADATHRFNAFALVLRPHIHASLHLVRTTDYPQEKLRAELQDVCARSELSTLVLDERLQT